MYASSRPTLKEWKQSGLSPKKEDLKEVRIAKGGVVNEWNLELDAILKSPRKVKGKFHTPQVDKDNEFIKNEAIQNAIPDFMHLPILHDFHKERTVGIVTKVVELSDGSFDFEGLIKATDDCNDIWDLIARGKYDQVSIFGKRTEGSASCGISPEQRTSPCTTTGVRLDSISVCDNNARNDGTSLMVAKSKVVFEATDTIIKAETTDSPLMHTITDKPKKCDCKKARLDDTPLPRVAPRTEKDRLKDYMDGKTDAPPVPQCDVKAKQDTAGLSNQRIPLKKPAPITPDYTRQAKPGDLKSGMLRTEKKAGGKHVTGSMQKLIDQLTEKISEMVQLDTEKKGLQKQENWKGQGRRNPSERPTNKPRGTRPGKAPSVDRNKGDPESRNVSGERPEWANKEEPVPPEETKDEEGKKYKSDVNIPANEPKIKERSTGMTRSLLLEPAARKQSEPDSSHTSVRGDRNEKTDDERMAARNRAESEANKLPRDPEREARPPKENLPPSKTVLHREKDIAVHEDSAKKPIKYKDTDAPPREAHANFNPGTHAGEPKRVEYPEPKEGPKPQYENRNPKPEPKPEYAGSKYTEHIDPENQKKKQEMREQQRLERQGSDSQPAGQKKPAPLASEEKVGKPTIGSRKESSIAPIDQRAVEMHREQQEGLDEPQATDREEIKDAGDEPDYSQGEPVETGVEVTDMEQPDTQEGLYSSLKRLGEAIAQLTASDKEVHEELEEEEDFEEEEEGLDTGYEKKSSKYEKKFVDPGLKGSGLSDKDQATTKYEIRSHKQNPSTRDDVEAEADSDRAYEGFRKLQKARTEDMNDEEVNTIVKAKVDEITKAYKEQIDELKTRIEKMESETIQKSGVVAILREGDPDVGEVAMTNAGAVASMGKKAKV